MELGSHWTDFYEIWYLNILLKYVEKIQVPLKSDNITVLYAKTYILSWKYLAEFFLQ
jgi:hypothetical protein